MGGMTSAEVLFANITGEATNFTSILPSLRIFSLKTYEISDLRQLVPDLGQDLGQTSNKS